MKLIISLMLSLAASASPIRIFHEKEPERAHLVKEIFLDVYSIPAELISLKEVEDCLKLSEKGRLDLCIKSNGDLEAISVDRIFITESLKIFHAQ
jgi:hypothetical protein